MLIPTTSKILNSSYKQLILPASASYRNIIGKFPRNHPQSKLSAQIVIYGSVAKPNHSTAQQTTSKKQQQQTTHGSGIFQELKFNSFLQCRIRGRARWWTKSWGPHLCEEPNDRKWQIFFNCADFFLLFIRHVYVFRING